MRRWRRAAFIVDLVLSGLDIHIGRTTTFAATELLPLTQRSTCIFFHLLQHIWIRIPTCTCGAPTRDEDLRAICYCCWALILLFKNSQDGEGTTHNPYPVLASTLAGDLFMDGRHAGETLGMFGMSNPFFNWSRAKSKSTVYVLLFAQPPEYFLCSNFLQESKIIQLL